MWIVMNDAFISIVQSTKNENEVVVRARVAEDLANVWPEHKSDIIETSDSDYRYRLFLNKEHVAETIKDSILDIDYPNFKNSVKQTWRKNAYMKIWSVMYDVQESLNPSNWYSTYRR